jgi:hypothetical protein
MMFRSSDQAGEGARETTKPEHTKNPLVDFSARVPPEILGQIFHWDVAPDDCGGLREGSYQFLLVCRRWYNVAKATPELWSFWGNNLYHWSQRYQLSERSAPIDLAMSVLQFTKLPMDEALRSALEPLQNALNERVASNSIRSVYLCGFHVDEDILNIGSVVSLLASGGGGIQYRDSSIESVEIDSSRLDSISSFLTRYRFPKLWHLRLNGMTVDSEVWDHLRSYTGSLTSLTLGPLGGTLHQLLSVFGKNHQLRSLNLTGFCVGNNSDARCESRVSLPHLKRLALTADFRSTFRLLDLLDLPELRMMDFMRFVLSDCPDPEDLSRAVGRYMQGFLCQERFKNRLGIWVRGGSNYISFRVITKDTNSNSTLLSTGESRFQVFAQPPLDFWPDGTLHTFWQTVFVNLACHIPKGVVISFEGRYPLGAIGEAVATMSDIQELHLNFHYVPLSVGFMQLTPPANTKLFPSLRSLHLGGVIVSDKEHGWQPLVDYLHHRQTSGGQPLFLQITVSDCSDISWDEEKKIRELVEKLVILGRCREPAQSVRVPAVRPIRRRRSKGGRG